ncbi:MAG: VIT1/CCC1 transporter family protein [Patescibacteria group bacterium]
MNGNADHNAGKFLRSATFGINDGIVSTLALISGLDGALIATRVIIISTLVELFAGAFSMAAGTYISSKSQSEFYRRALRDEEQDIRHPRRERQHLLKIYREKGLRGKELKSTVNKILSNKHILRDVMAAEEVGVSEKGFTSPWKEGAVMFFSFLFAGVLLLIPYVFPIAASAFRVSTLIGLTALFGAGVLKTHFTKRPAMKSGVETLVIGIIATVVSHMLGELIHTFV